MFSHGVFVMITAAATCEPSNSRFWFESGFPLFEDSILMYSNFDQSPPKRLFSILMASAASEAFHHGLTCAESFRFDGLTLLPSKLPSDPILCPSFDGIQESFSPISISRPAWRLLASLASTFSVVILCNIIMAC